MAPPRPVDEGAPRVLLITDDPAVKQVVPVVLEGRGYQVDQVPDGPAARRALGEDVYTLLFVDVVLRDAGSGFVFLRELRSSGIATPIVVLTSSEEADDLIAAFRLGASDVLRKPLRPTTLAAIVRRLMGSGLSRAPRLDPPEEEEEDGSEVSLGEDGDAALFPGGAGRAPREGAA